MNGLAKEVRTEVTVFRVQAKCEEPGCTGVLVYTGVSRTAHVPIYEHRCLICGHILWFSQQYPRIAYEESGPPGHS